MLYFYFYKMIPVNDVDPNGRINMVREGVLAHKAACHSQNVGTIEFLQKKDRFISKHTQNVEKAEMQKVGDTGGISLLFF